MGKLKQISGREVCNILRKNGFKKIKQKGSHISMQKQMENGTLTIIVPDHREIRKGALSSIVRQSKLERSLFESH